jgi:hypothetical protein
MGRAFMRAVRRFKWASSATAGRVGYRGGVKAMRFAMRLILDSGVVLVSEGIDRDKMSRDVSGRRPENSVRDPKGRRSGKSGMVRM